jgi:NAD-dependent dihydropyrimidine dehydrogenase PreA subunit
VVGALRPEVKPATGRYNPGRGSWRSRTGGVVAYPTPCRQVRRSIRVSHYITEACIGVKDTSCVDVCPVDCIHPRKDEPDFAKVELLFINPETCIDCGLCIDECPVDAIFNEDDLPDHLAHFIEKNAAYYRK